jgi:hypothetical protein
MSSSRHYLHGTKQIWKNSIYLSNPRVEFEPKIPVIEKVKTFRSLGYTVTVIAFPTVCLQEFVVSSNLATCTAHHKFLDFTTLMTADNVYIS